MIVWIAIASVCLVSAGVQAFLVWGFLQSLSQSKRPLLPDDECPKSAVVLCLRGGDPYLIDSLDGLFHQDYPDFKVFFVVDHESDPALQILNQFIEKNKWDRCHISILKEKHTTCSLKCSSLLQALQFIGSEFHFIALVDADTVTHRSWLRELATALQGESVGAVTGNRWYMPDQVHGATMIRYIWNAAAVVQMYWYRIAWGGTVAIKRQSIIDAELTSKWSRSLCEDTMLRKQLASIGQQVEFVPSLMMVNRENCDLPGFYGWVKRQLLTARLYHPLWPAVVGHAISSALLLLLGWGFGFYFLMTRELLAGIGLLVSMILFQIFLTLMIPWLEFGVSRVVAQRGEPIRWRGANWTWELIRGVFVTQWVYTAALIGCLRMRETTWRGIHYKINGPWEINMTGYVPYESSSDPAATHSL